MGEETPKCVAVGCAVWLDGEEWATCRTPGQAARIAEDMRAARRMRVQLGGLQGWCERNGHDYALTLVLAALGPDREL